MYSDYKIILGSASPRRKQLLSGIGINFEVKLPSERHAETYPDSLKDESIPLFLAEQKASYYNLNCNELLITADTIVYDNEKVLGKPQSVAEARAMLKQLSGHTHKVITGVCLKTKFKIKSFTATTLVKFSSLTDEEIDHYINNFKPFDKAGSYGIQEWIGFIGVENIVGCYYNVMGLPTQKLYNTLKNF